MEWINEENNYQRNDVAICYSVDCKFIEKVLFVALVGLRLWRRQMMDQSTSIDVCNKNDSILNYLLRSTSIVSIFQFKRNFFFFISFQFNFRHKIDHMNTTYFDDWKFRLQIQFGLENICYDKKKEMWNCFMFSTFCMGDMDSWIIIQFFFSA